MIEPTDQEIRRAIMNDAVRGSSVIAILVTVVMLLLRVEYPIIIGLVTWLAQLVFFSIWFCMDMMGWMPKTMTSRWNLVALIVLSVVISFVLAKVTETQLGIPFRTVAIPSELAQLALFTVTVIYLLFHEPPFSEITGRPLARPGRR